LMKLLENQYAVLVLCLLTVPAAAAIAITWPQYAAGAMALVAVASLSVRFVQNRALKALCYMLLGFISFWGAGNALFVPLGMEVQLFSFLPFLLLGITNATAALVAYNDGYINGLIFASAGLIAILFTKGPLDTGGADRFLITAMGFTAASFLFVMFASWAKSAAWALYNAFKASIAAGVIYGLLYLLRLYDVNALNFSNFGALYAKLSGPFINVLWMSLLANVFIVGIALLGYELLLYVFALRRSVAPDRVLLMKAGEVVGEEDPYAQLVTRLEKFFKEFSNYDVGEAAETLAGMEKEYYELARVRADAPLRQNAGKMLMEARSLLLGLKLEGEKVPAAAPQPSKAGRLEKKPELWAIPKGSVVLLEGPIGSRKEEFGLGLLAAALKGGSKCAVVSFEPEKEEEYIGEKGVQLVKVEQNINDMALSISHALEANPDFMFFNVLYWLIPNHPVQTLSGFLASTAKKLKKSGATAVFVMENEMVSPQELSTLESIFDGILEFSVAEKDGYSHSRYRVKEFKFKKFDPDWREYW